MAVLKEEKEFGIWNSEFGNAAESVSSIDYIDNHIQRDQQQEPEERVEPSTINHQPFFQRAYRYIQSISEYAPSFGSKFRIENVTEESNWIDRKNKNRKTAKKRVKDLKKMW
jgi:hypothetical protein